MRLTLRTLGVLRLTDSATEILPGRRKELVLLTYLALRGLESVTRDELAEMLWGDRPDANARQSLRQALVRLRRETSGLIVVDDQRVAVNPDMLDVDVADFEGAVSAGRLSDAVKIWSGDFLTGAEDIGGSSYRAWLESRRESLRARLAWSLDRLATNAETRGAWAEAVEWLSHWVASFPLEEPVHHRFIEALHLAGHVDRAVSHHAEFAARLRREMDVEPSESYLRLGRQLENADRTKPIPRSGAGSTVLFTPDLAGRDSALAALNAAYARTRGDAMQVVLVEGEEGIGKTRLCEEFIKRLGERAGKILVLRARGNRANSDTSGETMRALLAGLSGAPGIKAAPAGALTAMARFVPDLFVTSPGTALGGDPAWSIDEAIERVLSEVAAEVPIVALIDDVAWADDASQNWITALVRENRRISMLFVVTAQPDDAVSGKVLDALRSAHGARRLPLPPLEATAVDDIVASMLDMPPHERRALSTRLYAESAGNPLLVIQLLAALLDEDRIRADETGTWRMAAGLAEQPLPQPAAVRDALARRLAHLSEPARELAEAIAVFAIPVDGSYLNSVTRLSEGEIETAIGELVARRLIRTEPGGSGYEFVHEVSRRITFDLIPLQRRRTLHGLVGRAIKAKRFGGRPSLRAAYAFHKKMAGPTRMTDVAVPWRRVAILVSLIVGAVGVRAAWSARRTRVDFTDRQWVVLGDLVNTTGDTVFDRSLATAFNASLGQSQHVNVLPPSRVRETLRRMELDSVTYLSESIAREVAVRENAHLVIELAISQFDSIYVLAGTAVDPNTGDRVLHLTARAPGKQAVLSTLDDLARSMRRALGESRRDVALRSVSLPRATTSSLEALKRYADGSAAWSAGRWQDARALWTEAVALDTNFVRAHAALANLHYWANDRTSGEKHYAKAMSLLDRLPERERLWTRARLADAIGNHEEVIDLLSIYTATYPDDRDAWYNLATEMKEAARCGEAAGIFDHVLAIDPQMVNALINLAVCRDLLGQAQEAVSTFEHAFAIDSAARSGGAGFDINRIYGFALLKLGDSSSARSVFGEMLVRSPDHRANGRRSLALAEMYLGRYRLAITHLKEAIVLNQATGARTSEFRNRMYLAGAYQALGMFELANGELEIADGIATRTALAPAWLAFLAQRYARAGDVVRAEHVRELMTERLRPDAPGDRAALEQVNGEILLSRGDEADAIQLLELAYRLDPQDHMLEALANAHMAAGNLDIAQTRYAELLEHQPLGWEAQQGWLNAHDRMARIYENAGNVQAALQWYRRLVGLWQQGDDDLVLLEDARSRMSTLLRGERRSPPND